MALMLELVRTPVSDENTLTQLKGIVLKSREDQKQSPPAIARALYLYNRYGAESPMLESLTSEEIMQSGLDELLALPVWSARLRADDCLHRFAAAGRRCRNRSPPLAARR